MDYYQASRWHDSSDTEKIEPYNAAQNPESLDTDFRRKFPPEQVGQEMDPGARVWKVYREEATANDATTLEGWSNTLDILLIFAGLFSAVATAFVVESYKSLQLDSKAYTANVLYALLNQTSPSSVASMPLPPVIDASPSALSRWINGLWFTSLMLALAVALLCILVKQWIVEYKARNTASARNARDWARRHQVYFQALSRWPVGQLVSVLPLMLHLSLFLFIAGVVAFLWDLDMGIGIWVFTLGTGLMGFYLTCFLLPLWHPEAPTSTPLIHHVRPVIWALRVSYWRCIVRLLDAVLHFIVFLSTNSALRRVRERWSGFGGSIARSVQQRLRAPQVVPVIVPPTIPTPTLEQRVQKFRTTVNDKVVRLRNWRALLGRPKALLSPGSALDIYVLRWLILSVSDSDAVAVGLQALGSRSPNEPWTVHLRYNERIRRLPIEAYIVSSGAPLHPLEAARALRAILCLRRNQRADEYWDDDGSLKEFGVLRDLSPAVHNVMLHSNQPDAALLSAYHRGVFDRIHRCAPSWLAAGSPSLTGTVMILFRTHKFSLAGAFSLMCCVRFTDMSDSDWWFVLTYFRSCHPSVDPCDTIMHGVPSRDQKDHFKKELFCHAVRLHKAVGDDRRPRAAAAALLTHLFRSDTFSWGMRESVMPWVLDYLASEAFTPVATMSRPLDRAVLDHAVLFLTPNTRKYEHPEYYERLMRAYSHVIHACEVASIPVAEMHDVVGRCYDLISAIFHRRLPHSMSRRLVPSFQAHRHMTLEYGECSVSSLWDLMRSLFRREQAYIDTSWRLFDLLLRLANKDGRLWLMDHAAAGLCILARENGGHRDDLRTACIEPFLLSMPLRSLIPLVPSGTRSSESMPGLPIRIGRHCIELSPTWWRDGIAEIAAGNVTEDLCCRVFCLGIALHDVGPCTQCPGDQPDWLAMTDLEDKHNKVLPNT